MLLTQHNQTPKMNTQTAIMLYKGVFKMNKDQEILEYLKGVLSVEQELILDDNMVVFFTTDDGCYSLDKEHSICGNIWNNLSFEVLQNRSSGGKGAALPATAPTSEVASHPLLTKASNLALSSNRITCW